MPTNLFKDIFSREGFVLCFGSKRIGSKHVATVVSERSEFGLEIFFWDFFFSRNFTIFWKNLTLFLEKFNIFFFLEKFYNIILLSSIVRNRKNLSTFQDISIVHIYFPIIESTLFRADVLMTWQEIVSNFGGLLGLCVGFSLVSIIEIFYFLTVRLYQNIASAKDLQPNSEDTQFDKKTQIHSGTDRKIREMYVNDFKNFNRQFFRSRN